MVFSDPNVAIIGHSYRELSSLEILIGENAFHNQGRSLTAEKNKGVIRVYAEPNSDKLLGAEMVCPPVST